MKCYLPLLLMLTISYTSNANMPDSTRVDSYFNKYATLRLRASQRLSEVQMIYAKNRTEENRKNWISSFLNSEHLNNAFIEEGLELWECAPNDIKWIAWLNDVSGTIYTFGNLWKEPEIAALSYLSDHNDFKSYYAKIDEIKLLKWRTHFEKMRLFYSRYTSNMPIATRISYMAPMYHILINFHFHIARNKYSLKDSTYDFGYIRQLIADALFFDLNNIDSANTSNDDKDAIVFYTRSIIRSISANLFMNYRQLGISDSEIIELLENMNKSESPMVRTWANQHLKLFNLSRIPMELVLKTTTGTEISLKQFRNKNVVLLDIWNVGCTNCIDRMPYFRELHKKYNSHGFEIISICLDSDEKKKIADSIHQAVGANAPLVMGGKTGYLNSKSAINNLTQYLMKEYGFLSVPQLILLDKSGRMILYNNELLNGDCEPLLNNALLELHLTSINH